MKGFFLLGGHGIGGGNTKEFITLKKLKTQRTLKRDENNYWP